MNFDAYSTPFEVHHNLNRTAHEGMPVVFQACKQLVELGPCYAELLALHPGVSGQPRWQADSVLAAEMQFRLQTLAPCAAKLPQVSLPSTPISATNHSTFRNAARLCCSLAVRRRGKGTSTVHTL